MLFFSPSPSSPLPLLLLLFLSLLFSPSQSNFFEFFYPQFSHGPHFSGNKFYRANVNLKTIDGHVAAFGDFNSDRYIDVFMVSKNATKMSVHLWKHDDYEFGGEHASIKEDHIIGVIPCDFTYDGYLDVLIAGISPSNPDRTYLHLYIGKDHNHFDKKPIKLPDAIGMVELLDADGDLKVDLYGVEAKSGERAFWLNHDDGSHFSIQKVGKADDYFSAAFTDLNGDCRADLIVSKSATAKKYLEHENGQGEGPFLQRSWTDDWGEGGTNDSPPQLDILINDNDDDDFFSHDKTFDLLPGATLPTFADFDADGTIDIAYGVCYPRPNCTLANAIYIAYNSQKKMCKNIFASGCFSVGDMCKNDHYKFPDLNSGKSDEDIVIQLNFPKGVHLQTSGPHPFRLRHGDYDLDGYPDILVPLEDDDGRRYVELWRNVPCDVSDDDDGDDASTSIVSFSSSNSLSRTMSDSGSDDDDDGYRIDGCSHAATKADRRTFKRQSDSAFDEIREVDEAYAGSFIDLDEDGTLDILLLSANRTGEGGKTRAIYNNIFVDAFFIKTLGLNGVCAAWCDTHPKFPDPKPFGVNFPGGAFKFTVTDFSGNKNLRYGVQMTQTSFLALQTPYQIFGIGRISNYIENMFYGTTQSEDNTRNFDLGIIPNSQIVTIPYKHNEPDRWSILLYINPTSMVFWTACALAGFLVFLGLVIFGLDRREKAVDEKEKKERAHLFSFDAM